MSGKNQFPLQFNWQSTSPTIGFFPVAATGSGGSVPSGVLTGTMSGTNTIYSNIVRTNNMDNIGLSVSWTGTPTGTFQVMGMNADLNPFALTFNPALTQPSGSAGNIGVNLNQFPWTYLFVQYTNSSGSGVLTVTAQMRDLN